MPRLWMPSARAVLRPPSLRTSRSPLAQSLLSPCPVAHLPLVERVRFFSASSASPPHLFDRVLDHAPRVALYEDGKADPWTYAQLLDEAASLRDTIRQALPVATNDPHAPRIASLGSRDASYVAIQWATWLAGGVAVPLHPAHPPEELQYILDDSEASVLVVSREFLDHGEPKNDKLLAWIQQLQASGKIAVVPYARPTPQTPNPHGQSGAEHAVREWLHTQHQSALSTGAHIVYTSGTTGRPKGVVTSHAALTAQTADVVSAWEMTKRDHLLHFLPLHHVHGILNNLQCVHYAGGSLEFLASAKAELVWRKLLEAQAHGRPVSMLMAVPTVYMNLLEEMEKEGSASYDKQTAVEAARQLRVAISGSMACPVSILNRWEELTGLRLLERYGMTELGMVLTNPLHGERHLGYVGQPFPSVRVRLVDPETDQEVPLDGEGEGEGELRVQGPTVFREYWRKPQATAKEFDADGWFKTGDIAQYDPTKQSFRIRGRASADILKSGGFKISALDVERVLLTYPGVLECAVFGMADDKWGQIVAAVVRVAGKQAVEEADVRTFCRDHLADYCVPRKMFFVDEIPKNAMGKVNKKALAALFAGK